MKTILGIKYKLSLLPEQKLFISICSGNQRFLYNLLWAKIKEESLSEKVSYEKNFKIKETKSKERKLTEGYRFQEAYLRELSKPLIEEFPFLKYSDSQSIQYTIKFLSQAVKEGINKKNKKTLPVFKKKNKSRNSFRLTNHLNSIEYEKETKSIYVAQMKTFMKKYMEETGKKYSKKHLEKLYNFKLKINNKSQDKGFPRDLSSYTFSKNSAGEYFVSASEIIEMKQSILELEPPEEIRITGIDLGFKDKVIYENGEVEKRVKHYAKKEKELREYKRKLSKIYEKFKKQNRNKAEITIKDKKKKLKNKYSNSVNDLKIVSDYKLTKEQWKEVNKFSKVKRIKKRIAVIERKTANRRNDENHKISRKIIDNNDIICLENLNFSGMQKLYGKSILDLALSDLVQKIKYKAENQGKILIFVDRFYPSSKTCNCCGYHNKNLKLSERQWLCPECETILNRDVNAAKNIRKEGIRILLRDIAAGESGVTAERQKWIEKLSTMEFCGS